VSAEPPLLQRLVEALRCLPGVGPKSAQRMAFHLLERDREGGRRLAAVLAESMERIGHCQRCRTLSDREVCALCANPNRDDGLLCVVETPTEVLAIEQSTGFKGRYFVLAGACRPRRHRAPRAEPGRPPGPPGRGGGAGADTGHEPDGRGCRDGTLHQRDGQGVWCDGDRIAHGVPLGGELDYVDGGTLAHAFAGRHRIG